MISHTRILDWRSTQVHQVWCSKWGKTKTTEEDVYSFSC